MIYPAPPTLAEAAARLRADDTDPVFVACYESAVAQQATVCDVSAYNAALFEACHRRIANLWASKSHTLGVLDTGTDFGVQYVPQYDPMLDALERPYRYETTVVA